MCVLALVLLMGHTSPVGATVLSYTDTQFGNSIDYVLSYNSIGANSYAATFTITSTAGGSPQEYAGWSMFDTNPGNTQADITNLAAPSSFWSISDVNQNSNVQVLTGGGNYSSIGGGGASGFYVTSFSEGNGPVVENQALLVTGAAQSYSFTFDFNIADVRTTDMPFQVGYYDGLTGNENISTGRLSEDLTTKVPEPSSLWLMGMGLLGLGFFSRKRH